MGKGSRARRAVPALPEMVAEDTLTYRDYRELPEDGHRYEIIGGDLFNAPAPYLRHQRVSFNILRLLDRHCSEQGELIYAPADVVLSDVDVVQPDILWISKERLSIITERNIQGAPDLVIEITSDRTRRRDAVVKKKLYGRFGVKEYWLVDPEDRSVWIFRRAGRGLRIVGTHREQESFSSRLFPGLTISLAEIFA